MNLIKKSLVIVMFSMLHSFLWADEIKSEFYIYTVKDGNLLQDICEIFNVSEQDLKKYNPSKTLQVLLVGNTIKIPLEKSSVEIYKVQKGDSVYSIAKRYNIPVAYLQKTLQPKIQKNMWVDSTIYIPTHKNKIALAQPIPAHSNHDNKTSYYTVKAGDTYYGLSKKLSIPVKNLQEINHNKDLKIGLKIIIPDSTIKKQSIVEKKETKIVPPVSSAQDTAEKEDIINPQNPFKGRLLSAYPAPINSYSPLVSGVTYTSNPKFGKYVYSPLKGMITDIKPLIGFGMGIFIQNGNTTVILASKGFSNFLFKAQNHVNAKQTIAYIDYGYKLYVFMIQDGKILPPF